MGRRVVSGMAGWAAVPGWNGSKGGHAPGGRRGRGTRHHLGRKPQQSGSHCTPEEADAAERAGPGGKCVARG